jgi:hypothetical protein
LILSEIHDQKTSWIKKSTYAGMVSRFVSKVSKPSDLRLSVRYAVTGLVGISIVRLMTYSGQRS